MQKSDEELKRDLGSKIVGEIRNALSESMGNLGENAAFREWLSELKPGDRMPRGRYFDNKRTGKFKIFYDEPIEFSYFV